MAMGGVAGSYDARGWYGLILIWRAAGHGLVFQGLLLPAMAVARGRLQPNELGLGWRCSAGGQGKRGGMIWWIGPRVAHGGGARAWVVLRLGRAGRVLPGA